ncbi:MAG: mandelate racemase/muconate lactonizing enzyme family protein [Vicinamibacterales bacterium]
MSQRRSAHPDPSRTRTRVDRRTFLKTLTIASAGLTIGRPALPLAASLPKAKITKVRVYRPPTLNDIFNQSNMVVIVDTDQPGLFGVGEGGSRDTLEQCAGRLIGKNPFDIERCWQDMYRAWFYPPGREKIHGLGALDLALWDIKGKALGVPVYDLMGGMNRTYLESYLGGGGTGTQLRENARRAIEQGYRAFRMDAASVGGGPGGAPSAAGAAGGPVPPPLDVPRTLPGPVYDTHERVRQVARDCKDMREGVGPNGDWLIDLHQRFDFADGLRACKLIEEYEPYLVEDPTRTEHFLADIPKLRQLTTVPLAAGEEWGQRWDFNTLVENHDIDYVRCTLPNVGGITEMVKIAALCETHAVGIVPHFTGPISTAALVHAIGPFSGPVMVEIGSNTRPAAHINEGLDFKNGKIWPNQRPGLGVTLNMAQLTLVTEITQAGTGRTTYFRPDGSQGSW